MNRLPYDYYRCTSKMAEGEAIPMCAKCLRYTAPGNPYGQTTSTPPLFLDGKCPDQILEYGK